MTGEKGGSRTTTRQERKQECLWTAGKHPALSGTLTPIQGWLDSIQPSPSAPDSRGIRMTAEGQRLTCLCHACRAGSHTPFAEVTDEGSCPPTLMRCNFPHSIHVVRTAWTNFLLFFQKQRQEFILWAFSESGHWQKTSCSEISKECELESYCMTHPAVGFLLLLLYF